MPGMNGTGPEGQGSRTGRGAGRCAARRNMTEIEDTGQLVGQSNCRGGSMGRGRKGSGENSGCGNRKRFGGR